MPETMERVEIAVTMPVRAKQIMRPANSRNVGLDVARAVAIAMVFVAHGVGVEGKPFLGELGTGVDLFFVLSGFLIGRIYFRSSGPRKEFSFSGFWIARWWRTFPPYLLALGLYAAIRPMVAGTRPQQPLDWHYLVFIQNFFGMPAFGPSWSLCVEEHFYLLLPLLALLTERMLGRRSFRWVLPTAFFLPLMLRCGTLALAGGLPPTWYWYTPFHCEAMIAGLWLAYLFVEERRAFEWVKRPAMYLLPVIPVMLGVLPVWHRTVQVNVFVFTVLGMGYAAWLRVLYDLRWEPASWAGIWLRRAVQGLALCAYSVYLTHTTVDQLLRGYLGEHLGRGALRTGLILGGTLAFGVVFYFFVERTSIQTRDRYLRHRALRLTLDSGGGYSTGRLAS